MCCKVWRCCDTSGACLLSSTVFNKPSIDVHWLQDAANSRTLQWKWHKQNVKPASLSSVPIMCLNTLSILKPFEHKVFNISSLYRPLTSLRITMRYPEIKTLAIFNLELCTVAIVHHHCRFEIMTYLIYIIIIILGHCSLLKIKKWINNYHWTYQRDERKIKECFLCLNYTRMDMI